ncbi:MAG: histidine kinase, partial [Candidatus Melainabacteria bacterium HGW-Melainabacteria-1]
DRLKDEFLANTSHELRTPLNGIIGIADSMLAGATGPLSPRQHYNLSLLVSSGRRLANLVNDILDFSRLKHKHINLNLRPVALGPLTDVVLTLLMPLLGNKPIELINDIAPDCPSVLADENRLQQILFNLIGNAVKFTEAGEVCLSAQVQGEHLEIKIQDTGIGIPADKLERIFESFEQVEGDSARKYGGTGIGLAITRQLLELHGSQVRVSSVPGQGSCFSFSLPVTDESPVSDGSDGRLMRLAAEDPNMAYDEEAPEPAASETPDAVDRFRILIVDDERINSQVLANLLSLENYAIHQVSDGLEALDVLQRGEQFDLILLDIMMPKMSGYEVCRRIREMFPASQLPVLMLTAKNQVSDLVEGFSLGANDYLTKPFSRNELKVRIKTHIELAKINMAYSRFVPREFLSFLGRESIVSVQLGDQVQKEMAILFSDIRSFTSLSESMTPKENFDFLNSYLRRVSPAIRENGGIIDKYIGDAILALFPRSAEDGLKAAIDMLTMVRHSINPTRRARGYQPIEIGIGLHTGSLMLGTIGENERMEGTVIADAVNVASRLEGLTKTFQTALLVSEALLQAVPTRTHYAQRLLGHVQVKGKRERVRIYEVCEADGDALRAHKLATRLSFEAGVEAFEQGDYAQATARFGAVLADNSADLPALAYLQRANKLLALGVDLSDGVLEAVD